MHCGNNNEATQDVKLDQHFQSIRMCQMFETQRSYYTDNESCVANKIVIRKPWPSEYVRVLNSEKFIENVDVIYIDSTRSTYIATDRSKSTNHSIKKVTFNFAINDSNEIFIWPVKYAVSIELLDSWNRSAMYAVAQANTKWISIFSDRKSKSYILNFPVTEIPDPIWPDIDWWSTGNMVLERATLYADSVKAYNYLAR